MAIWSSITVRNVGGGYGLFYCARRKELPGPPATVNKMMNMHKLMRKAKAKQAKRKRHGIR